MSRLLSYCTTVAATMLMMSAAVLPDADAKEWAKRKTGPWPASVSGVSIVRDVPAFDAMYLPSSRPHVLHTGMIVSTERAGREPWSAVRFERTGYRIDYGDQQPWVAGSTTADERRGLPLPRPDRWTSLLATAALALFFFIRRAS